MAFCCVTLWCLESRFPYALTLVALTVRAPILLSRKEDKGSAVVDSSVITLLWEDAVPAAC